MNKLDINWQALHVAQQATFYKLFYNAINKKLQPKLSSNFGMFSDSKDYTILINDIAHNRFLVLFPLLLLLLLYELFVQLILGQHGERGIVSLQQQTHRYVVQVHDSITRYDAHCALGLGHNRAAHLLTHGDTLFAEGLMLLDLSNHHLFHLLHFALALFVEHFYVDLSQHVTHSFDGEAYEWTSVSFTGKN